MPFLVDRINMLLLSVLLDQIVGGIKNIIFWNAVAAFYLLGAKLTTKLTKLCR